MENRLWSSLLLLEQEVWGADSSKRGKSLEQVIGAISLHGGLLRSAQSTAPTPYAGAYRCGEIS